MNVEEWNKKAEEEERGLYKSLNYGYVKGVIIPESTVGKRFKAVQITLSNGQVITYMEDPDTPLCKMLGVPFKNLDGKVIGTIEKAEYV